MATSSSSLGTGDELETPAGISGHTHHMPCSIGVLKENYRVPNIIKNELEGVQAKINRITFSSNVLVYKSKNSYQSKPKENLKSFFIEVQSIDKELNQFQKDIDDLIEHTDVENVSSTNKFDNTCCYKSFNSLNKTSLSINKEKIAKECVIEKNFLEEFAQTILCKQMETRRLTGPEIKNAYESLLTTPKEDLLKLSTDLKKYLEILQVSIQSFPRIIHMYYLILANVCRDMNTVMLIKEEHATDPCTSFYTGLYLFRCKRDIEIVKKMKEIYKEYLNELK